MPEIPTHDYQCPCDMCEPEAHSFAQFPACDTAEQTGGLDFYGASPTGRAPSRPNIQDLNFGLEMALERAPLRKRSAPTLAPGAADLEAQAFEELVKRVGEGKARWTRLLELLEDGQS